MGILRGKAEYIRVYQGLYQMLARNQKKYFKKAIRALGRSLKIESEVEEIIYTRRPKDDYRYKPFYKTLKASVFTVKCSLELRSLVLYAVSRLEVTLSSVIAEN